MPAAPGAARAPPAPQAAPAGQAAASLPPQHLQRKVNRKVKFLESEPVGSTMYRLLGAREMTLRLWEVRCAGSAGSLECGGPPASAAR